jgi:hypothetical protein
MPTSLPPSIEAQRRAIVSEDAWQKCGPVISSWVGTTAQHGYGWIFSTTSGAFVIVPLRRASVRKLLQVFVVDEVYNGAPSTLERVRRGLYVALAALLLNWCSPIYSL